MEFLVWVGIMIVIAVVKGIAKLRENAEDSPFAPPPPSAPRPRPSTARRASAGNRPVTAPRVASTTRSAQAPGAAPPPVKKGNWRVPLDDLQDFLNDMEHKAGEMTQPRPPVPAPQLQRRIEAAKVATPPPVPTRPTAQPAAHPTTAPKVETRIPAPARRRNVRATQWREALGDRRNVRNIIIAAEIIGPPKSLRQD